MKIYNLRGKEITTNSKEYACRIINVYCLVFAYRLTELPPIYYSYYTIKLNN